MITQLLDNPVCWLILLLAFYCYQQVLMSYLNRHSQSAQQRDAQHEMTALFINALPLLGLLGTISGLLDCFLGLAEQGVSGERVTAGIADALLTTQLGLTCAIPAWLIHYVIKVRLALPTHSIQE